MVVVDKKNEEEVVRKYVKIESICNSGLVYFLFFSFLK